MKAIMISIQSKWVEKILNKEKTIEVRKSMPKCDLPIDVYIYCTKETQLVKYNNKYVSTDFFKGLEGQLKTYNGKVVAKFTLNKVEEIKYHFGYYNMGDWFESYILEKSCLNEKELDDYLQASKYYHGNVGGATIYGYAWHISNLEIFDEPKELSEFSVRYPKGDVDIGTNCKLHAMKILTKAPQSYCFIEIGE